MTPLTKDRPSFHIAQVYVDDICSTIGPWESVWEETSHAIVCRKCGDIYAKIAVYILRDGEPCLQPYLPTLDVCEPCGGGFLDRRIRCLRGLERAWPISKELLIRELTLAIKKEEPPSDDE